jgi:hypothetical protein
VGLGIVLSGGVGKKGWLSITVKEGGSGVVWGIKHKTSLGYRRCCEFSPQKKAVNSLSVMRSQ